MIRKWSKSKNKLAQCPCNRPLLLPGLCLMTLQYASQYRMRYTIMLNLFSITEFSLSICLYPFGQESPFYRVSHNISIFHTMNNVCKSTTDHLVSFVPRDISSLSHFIGESRERGHPKRNKSEKFELLLLLQSLTVLPTTLTILWPKNGTF